MKRRGAVRKDTSGPDLPYQGMHSSMINPLYPWQALPTHSFIRNAAVEVTTKQLTRSQSQGNFFHLAKLLQDLLIPFVAASFNAA